MVHYAADDMHTGIAEDLCRREAVRSEAEVLKPVLDQLEARLAVVESRPGPEATADGHFIMNPATTCWHWSMNEVYCESQDQHTPCGWQYLLVRHSRVAKFPSMIRDYTNICSICLPVLCQQLQGVHLSDRF